MGTPSKLGFAHFARKILTNTADSTLAPTTGVTKRVTVGGLVHETYTFTNRSVTITDNTTSGAHGNLKIVDLPEGNITILGATTNLTIARVGTNITATAAVVSSVGTVAAANTDATLTSTEANIVPSTVATLTAGAGVARGESTAVLVADGTATRVPVFLNFAMPDASSGGNDALTVNGTITIVYCSSNDN